MMGNDEAVIPIAATQGPTRCLLETGERIAVTSSLYLSRGGRKDIEFRVVGDLSCGWAEAVASWGGKLDMIVHRQESNHLVAAAFTVLPLSLPASQVLASSSTGPSFHGILLATIRGGIDAQLVETCFLRWQPLITIVALPASSSRKERTQWTRFGTTSSFRNTYHRRDLHCKHHDIGGVTDTAWYFVHFTKSLVHSNSRAVMMAPEFPRSLQTALHDTIGGHKGRPLVFEKAATAAKSEGINVVGQVSILRQMTQTPVYDASGLGPDLSQMSIKDRNNVWVQAISVYGLKEKSKKVLRRIDLTELFALWDYEGKAESEGWSTKLQHLVLRRRLQSPPAKMLRSFVFTAGEALIPANLSVPPSQLPPPGKTSDTPFSPMEEAVSTRVKAAQADNAAVDLSQWALPNETEKTSNSREIIRRLVMKWWALYQEESALRWLKNQGPAAIQADIDAINDCIRCMKGCTYWTWERGSRIFFWKFPEEWRNDFRDGVPFWKVSTPPKGWMRNMKAPTREAELLTRLKIFKLKFKHYITSEGADLAIPRFIVPKVVLDDGTIADVRCVWDCSINGHNARLFAPRFMLPTSSDPEEQVVKWLTMGVAEYLQQGSPPMDYTQDASKFIKSKQGDIDVGEHFNNFRVHPSDQHTLGVRYVYTDNSGLTQEREATFKFVVCPFGNKCSPYLCCQGEARILEICKGDPSDSKNEFQFESCHLNLPCSKGYDPSMPRVMLLRKDGELATTEVTFVDDCHVAGRAKEREFDHVMSGCKQLKSRMNSVGNQADDRKFRQPSYTPGAWNGVIIHTNTPFPHKSTTSKKWVKFKKGLNWVLEAGKQSFLDTGTLRGVAGLGVNITDVYYNGRCYLKGFFNAIEAWRGDRDLDGWRLDEAMTNVAQMEGRDASPTEFKKGYPVQTRVTSELRLHAQALLTLFVSDSPLMVPIRPTDSHKLRYIVGDASAEGFSIVTQYPNFTLESRDGLWDETFALGGSNLREAQNFANHCLVEIRSGKHDGCELWGGTDNAVWSFVWHKGMSTVRHLFALAVQLRVECQLRDINFCLFHISGDRMIATGIDGRSRGNLDAGVSLGYDICQFLPLNKGAIDQAGPLIKEFLECWMGADFSRALEPVEWFWEGHKPGIHVWAPPPAAALVALKQLARSRQKRPHSVSHVFVCQRLLWQEEWRRRFEKEVDVWFILHTGKFWPHQLFEPLIVGISFPMRNREQGPWLVRQQQDKVLQIGRTLCEMSKQSHLQVGHYMRKLWASPWNLDCL